MPIKASPREKSDPNEQPDCRRPGRTSRGPGRGARRSTRSALGSRPSCADEYSRRSRQPPGAFAPHQSLSAARGCHFWIRAIVSLTSAKPPSSGLIQARTVASTRSPAFPAPARVVGEVIGDRIPDCIGRSSDTKSPACSASLIVNQSRALPCACGKLNTESPSASRASSAALGAS